MTIEHVAVCDACGERRDAREDLSASDELWDAPASWVTIVSAIHDRHFCTWVCAEQYVAQMKREQELDSGER